MRRFGLPSLRTGRHTGRLIASGSALVMLLPACGLFQGPPPPPPPPPASVTLALGVDGGIDAADLVVTYPAGATFVGLTDELSDVIVCRYDDQAGSVHIALVATASVQGSLFSLSFADATAAEVSIASAKAYVRPNVTASAQFSLTEIATASQATQAQAQDSCSSAPTLSSQAAPSTDVPPLQASFANYPFGDLDQSMSVDVLDVLLDLDIAVGSVTPSDYQAYAGDVVADDAIDAQDVLRLLDKAVDPTLAAVAVIKPLTQRTLSYVALSAGTPVLVGNSGNAPLTGVSFSPSSGVHGTGSQPVAGQTAVFTFGSPNDDLGTLGVSAAGASASFLVGNLVVVVAGQSNAEGRGLPLSPNDPPPVPEVRMLGNDYVWQEAVEPLDDGGWSSAQGRCVTQVDQISCDSDPAQSFGVSLGTSLHAATDRYVYLIPTARGGTSLNWHNDGWDPTLRADPTDRSFLFGSAAYRGLVSSGQRSNPVSNPIAAEGGPVNVVAWYQGESDSRGNPDRSAYIATTYRVFNGFVGGSGVFGSGAKVVYAQLASYGQGSGLTPDEANMKNLQQNDIAERQREMEAGAVAFTSALDPDQSSVAPNANAFMVVTHDLPMSEAVHLSKAGQNELGQRIALAVEEHVLGMNVDGTGPRLVGLSSSGKVITVTTDRTIGAPTTTSASAYEGYFTVYDGAPTPNDIETPATYGGNKVAIASIVRGTDGKSVVITLQNTPSLTPYVRYARPYFVGDTAPRANNVIRDASSGLPLPSFGPLAAP